MQIMVIAKPNAIGRGNPKQADWLRGPTNDKKTKPFISGRITAEATVESDTRRRKRHNLIGITVCRLTDWRRTANRCDRGPKLFLAAVALTPGTGKPCRDALSGATIDTPAMNFGTQDALAGNDGLAQTRVGTLGKAARRRAGM